MCIRDSSYTAYTAIQLYSYTAYTVYISTVISHDSVTITTFSILPRANELLRVPQPVFPDRTGIGSIPAKRFLRLPQLTRYFIVPKSAKSSRFSSTKQNQLRLYSDTSPRASPVARDLFPLLHRCAGSDPAASNPRIALHPGLARSAPREASAAPQNAIFSLKVRARRPELPLPAKTKACVSPTRDGINWFYANLQEVLTFFSTGYFRLPNLT